MAAEMYDAIIVGVGQAGNPLSGALVRAGWRVAVVERRYVGGTCINEGCTPTKTLIASGRIAYLARRAADFGIEVDGVTVDWPTVRARQERLVTSWREGIEARIEDFSTADLIYGEARFLSPRRMEVALEGGGTRELQAEHIFLNTGTHPATPDIPGLEGTPYDDSRSILALEALPERLLILGGGYIGLEFAQLFRRLGSKVTVIQSAGQLVPREDADVAAALTDLLKEDGIEVLLDASTSAVAHDDDGFTLTVALPDGERQLNGERLLVATGRTPNTAALNLAAAGVETTKRGYIKTDPRCRTSVEGIFAMGDVTGAPAFTHIAYDDYRVVVDQILGEGQRTTVGRPVPYVLFTDPELGRVGLSEKEARKEGREFRVAQMPFANVARAAESGETRGLMKVIVDAESDQILGVAILGVMGGELMTLIQVAMAGELPWQRLRDMIFAHPTFAESFNNLFAMLDD